MIRVLIVDDSPTAREILVHVLGKDPEIEVVGVAKHGKEGVELAQKLQPDLVTMDIDMPVMNGFEATREIMSTAPVPIVIVSISTMVAEAKNAMRALQAGALTLICKPRGPGSASFADDTQRLIETVKTMAGVTVIRRRRKVSEPVESPHKASGDHVGVVAIAASAGGPPALLTVLSGLRSDFSAPIVVVQHLAEGFMDGLVSWLDGMISLNVKLAESGELMKAGNVYIAPEGQHLGVRTRGSLQLSAEDPVGGFRPSATFLFRSVGARFKQSAVGLILTGMGTDGLEGLRDIHQAGGTVIAQDEESCVVFGMPGAAVEAGIVNRVLPVDLIAGDLSRMCRTK